MVLEAFVSFVLENFMHAIATPCALFLLDGFTSNNFFICGTIDISLEAMLTILNPSILLSHSVT